MIYIGFTLDVGRLEWFDGQGDNPLPSKAIRGGSLGTVEAVIAHTMESRAGVRKGAELLAKNARSRLRAHRQTGAAHIGVTESPPNALDFEVWLGDADSADGNRTRKRSALSIEFGHTHAQAGHVKGLFILTGAANKLARRPTRNLG